MSGTLGNGTYDDIDINQSAKFIPILHKDISKHDESVFKLYASTSNDVWEIKFVISCVKSLMNYLSDVRSVDLTDKNLKLEELKDYY